jgi:hypothetical protein
MSWDPVKYEGKKPDRDWYGGFYSGIGKIEQLAFAFDVQLSVNTLDMHPDCVDCYIITLSDHFIR